MLVLAYRLVNAYHKVMSAKVCIYVPTYRNEQTTIPVLQSYLNQSYRNIEIHVYDNGYPEGYYGIKEFIFSQNDSRIHYHPNESQLGHVGNYRRIFSEIQMTSLALVLSSDQGLVPNAIEVMVRAKEDSKADIIFSAYKNFDVSNLDSNSVFSFAEHPHIIEILGIKANKTFSSLEIFELFFSDENINGEYYGFSLFGSLFDARLLQNLSDKWSSFAGHGGEHYLSMTILLRSKLVHLLSDALLLNVWGRPRIGGTERCMSDIYRIDCIMSAELILEEYSMLLESRGISLSSLRNSQIKKAEFFLNHYSGFRDYALGIIQNNKHRNQGT